MSNDYGYCHSDKLWDKVNEKFLNTPQKLGLHNPTSKDLDLTFGFICSILENLKKGGATGPLQGFFKELVLTELDNPEEFFYRLVDFACLE